MPLHPQPSLALLRLQPPDSPARVPFGRPEPVTQAPHPQRLTVADDFAVPSPSPASASPSGQSGPDRARPPAAAGTAGCQDTLLPALVRVRDPGRCRLRRLPPVAHRTLDAGLSPVFARFRHPCTVVLGSGKARRHVSCSAAAGHHGGCLATSTCPQTPAGTWRRTRAAGLGPRRRQGRRRIDIVWWRSRCGPTRRPRRTALAGNCHRRRQTTPQRDMADRRTGRRLAHHIELLQRPPGRLGGS